MKWTRVFKIVGVILMAVPFAAAIQGFFGLWPDGIEHFLSTHRFVSGVCMIISMIFGVIGIALGSGGNAPP